MTLIAVAPDDSDYGVVGPQDAFRLREPRAYQVYDLQNALYKSWPCNALLVGAVMREPGGRVATTQPRINKDGIPYLESLGYSVEVTTICADIDNPKTYNHVTGKSDKTPWTAETRKAAEEFDSDPVRHGSWWIYYTKNGRRLVQELARPVHPSQAEPIIRAFHKHIASLGWGANTDVTGNLDPIFHWNSFFALPNIVHATHGLITSSIVQPRRPPGSMHLDPVTRIVRGAVAGVVSKIDYESTLPPGWAERIKPLADWISGSSNRNERHLCLAG
jgi:hypothetical protein